MTLDIDAQAVALAMHKKRQVIVKRAACANGLYISPTSSDTFPSTQALSMQWDPTCFQAPSPQAVDIYMTAPYASNPSVYTWYSVANNGQYSATLLPRWWNSTTSVQLRLNIVPSGVPSFLTTLPPSDLFTVTYNPATASSGSSAAQAANTSVHGQLYTVVNNWLHNKGLSKGGLAAAVLFPLLIVFGAIAVYVKLTRAKEKKKRQRWSKAVDKRMSTISTDWKSMTGAAASHAIRQSMVIGAGDRSTRASSFFAGNGPLPSAIGRPHSSASLSFSNGLGLGGNQNAMDSTDDMIAQLRRPADAITGANPVARVSRVSFATDVHPRSSMAETRASIYTNGTGVRASRAYHKSWYVPDDGSVPPVPERRFAEENMKDTDFEMTPTSPTLLSPTQKDGPEMLTPAEIRSKIAGGNGDEPRPSVDVGLLKMPAMTLMRTSDASNDLVITTAGQVPHAIDYPALPRSPMSPTTNSSPFSGMFGGLTPLNEESAMSMSPDAMLEAYRQKHAPKPTPAKPVGGKLSKTASVVGGLVKRRNTSNEKAVPTTTSANGGMRVLYAPPTNDVRESAYDEDSYSGSHGAPTTHYTYTNNTDSVVASTEEGVVTYGSKHLVGGGGISYAGGLGPAGPEDKNPFRITSTSGLSDVSRYSGTGSNVGAPGGEDNRI